MNNAVLNAYNIEIIIGPYVPYNVTVFAVNEFGNGKRTMKNAFTKQGGQQLQSILHKKKIQKFTLFILTIVPNVPPRNLKVFRSDKTEVTVTWTPMNLTEARGYVTGYKITYSSLTRRRRSTDEKTAIAYGRFHNSYVITGLDAMKKYGVTVAGMTSAGVGTATDVKYDTGQSSTFS